MRRILFACFCLLLSGALSAQVTSRLGRFQVDFNQGCAPFTVTITDTNLTTTGECTPGKPCIMTFEGSTQLQNTFTHIYTTPGTFKLSVLYQSIGADDITITVDPDILPNFEIYRCSGNAVRINATDNTYAQYVIDYGDGTPTDPIPFGITSQPHTYAVAGNYSISVHGRSQNPNARDNCTARTQAITSLTSLPNPTISSITATSASSVTLELAPATPQFILYHLEILLPSNPNFQVHSSVYNKTTIDVTNSNLQLDKYFYCFRLSAFDPCTGGNTYSNVVCTQDFDVNFTNGTNKLTWRTATAGISSVSILRKDITNGTSQTTGLPGAPLVFNDTDYDCNVQYCYTLTVNYGTVATSTSLEKCGVGILTTIHPAIDDLQSTVVAGGVNLIWKLPVPPPPTPPINLKNFQVMRSSGSAALALFTTTNTEALTDATYTTAGAYCYQVNYTDQCDNSSAPGVIGCPVRLFGTIDAANAVTLNWSKFSGWKDGINSYAVVRINSAGSTIQTINVGLDTSYVDSQPDVNNQIITYEVRVIPNIGNIYSYSNELTFTKDINLTFPTAFTPNGDKLNDIFIITGQYVANMNIRIFDRWGGLVFASERNEPWNGTREGTAMPESTYVWKAEITDLAGRSFSREGTLLLLRK